MAHTKVEKLAPNLRNKERYSLHYRNLHRYFSLRMRLKKIHRALKFKQSPWMEPYIRINKEFRREATSSFENELYKLLNNNVFGKTRENFRKRVDVMLVRAKKKKKKKKKKRKKRNKSCAVW